MLSFALKMTLAIEKSDHKAKRNILDQLGRCPVVSRIPACWLRV